MHHLLILLHISCHLMLYVFCGIHTLIQLSWFDFHIIWQCLCAICLFFFIRLTMNILLVTMLRIVYLSRLMIAAGALRNAFDFLANILVSQFHAGGSCMGYQFRNNKLSNRPFSEFLLHSAFVQLWYYYFRLHCEMLKAFSHFFYDILFL